MKEVILSTNLHCSNCVTKLGKQFDKQTGIHHWHADLDKPGKPVTVYGNLTNEELINFINQAGFQAELISSQDQINKDDLSAKHNFWEDRSVWKRASFNTINCLIGCTLGDFAMLLFLQTAYPLTPMWLQMVLATLAGLLTSITMESVILHVREKLIWKSALKMAVSMSFLSMIAMEIAMNTTDFMITGGKAQLGSPIYWLAFLPAAVAGFLTPLPYNYYKLKKYNHSCH